MNRKMKNYVICILIPAFILGGLVLSLLLPDKTFSDAERRKLMAMPSVSMNSIGTGKFMKDFEKYTLDQFPAREMLRSLKAGASKNVFHRMDYHNLYEEDGYLAAMEYPLDESSIKRASERFLSICQKYKKPDSKVYFSVIPDKNMFLGKKSGHLYIDYEEFEKTIRDMTGFAEFISIDDLLSIDDYYRTDTHFRQEKIVDVADRLLKSMKAPFDAQYKTFTALEEFEGVYKGQMAGNAPAEPLKYLWGGHMDSFRVQDLQNNKEIGIYEEAKLKGKDPYEFFLSGPLSLLTIENPDAENDRNLVVFRDSFASSIGPLLAEGYKKVTFADIRYIYPDYLDQFISFENSDILFLYSTLVLNNSETMK